MRLFIAGLFLCSICAVSQAQPVASALAPGAVATHLIGRMLISADGTGQLVGYYPYIDGVPGPFFAGDANNERSAYFTFRSAPFRVQVVHNGEIVHLFSQPLNDTAVVVTAYYNATPGADFSNPDSFSAGQAIAAFRTRKGMATALPGIAGLEVGTLDLTSTADFSFQGQTYNLAGLGSSITQTTIWEVRPALGGRLRTPASFPFGGSAIVTGSAGTLAPLLAGKGSPRKR